MPAPAWQPPVPLRARRVTRAPRKPRVRRVLAAHAGPSRVRSRRSVLRLALCAPALLSPAARALAVCGSPDPYFAHYVDWREGFARTVGGRRVHFRCVGDRRSERKMGHLPVVYVGDAGVALASGEPLELLAESGRRVVLLDMLGVGESEALALAGGRREGAVREAWEEVSAVVREVGAGDGGRVHVVACGFGLEVAEALVGAGAEGAVGVASVVAEAWGDVRGEGREGVTFERLQGDRVCAVEGAEGGDAALVRTLYAAGRGRSPMAEAVERVARRVPTLALRTGDVEPLGDVRGAAMFEETVLKGAGRVAHLAATEDTLKAMDDFFTKVEGAGKAG